MKKKNVTRGTKFFHWLVSLSLLVLSLMAYGEKAQAQAFNQFALQPIKPITPLVKPTPLINSSLIRSVLIPWQVSVGPFHTVALKSDGTVWAWGRNHEGELGNGRTDDSSTPVQVYGLTGIRAVSADNEHSLALKSDGTVWAWGYNYEGQLGIGSSYISAIPLQVMGLQGITAISTGMSHNLALDSNGRVWFWGVESNEDGWPTRYITSPIQVSGLPEITAISAGAYHSLALDKNGNVWAWGHNGAGQLGEGTQDPLSDTPVQVLGLTAVKSISAGSGSNLALKSDGTVWGWGSNSYGQLGSFLFAQTSQPVPVAGLEFSPSPGTKVGVTTISAGRGGVESRSLALRSDGKVWAWGYGLDGGLGNGSTMCSSIPVEVLGLSEVTSLSQGGNSSFAVKSDGSVWEWGTSPVRVALP